MAPEERLREQAKKVPPIAGPPDEVDRITKRMRARKRLATGAVTATVVAVALGASLVLTDNEGSGSDLATTSAAESQPDAPWIGTPGKQFDPATAHWRQWRACSPADIAVAAGRNGARHGNATQLFSLENVSTSDCRLSGPPRITADALTGAQSVEPGHFSGASLPIPAGSAAIVVAGAPAGCGEPQSEDVARNVDVSVAGGPAQRIPDIWLSLHCGAPRLMVFESMGADPSPGGLSSLEATWEGPTSSSPGATLDYLIALHNPTTQTISLQPCSSYTQAVEDLVAKTYLLNCEAVPSIGPGETKTFAMRLTIPETDRTVVKVGWHIEVEAGTTAGTIVTLN